MKSQTGLSSLRVLSKHAFKIYELDPEKPLSVRGLAWETVLKNSQVKLDLLIAIDVLLMVGKGKREGTSHSIYRYAKTNNKHMKHYVKNKES